MSRMGEEYNKRLEKYAPDLLEALRDIETLTDAAKGKPLGLETVIHGIAERAIAKVVANYDL